MISLPTYPKFCWYATGTTHIFHLGLSLSNLTARLVITSVSVRDF